MPLATTSNPETAASLLGGAPSPVIVIPVYNAYEDAVQCLDAVMAHTSPAHAVLVVDDGGDDRRFAAALETADVALKQDVVVLRHERNVGFVRSCNEAFTVAAGRDVVLLNSDVIVGPEWLERLRAAALDDDSVATATSMTNHGTILSVPHRNEPTGRLPTGLIPKEAALRVARHSLQLRPTIPTAIGHCCYIRRHALDLVGPFDEMFSPGYGEEVDFSQRCVAAGFRHVCADDVFTYHRGGRSFDADPEARDRAARHEAIIRRRYPWYEGWVAQVAADELSQLAHAIEVARRALVGLAVGVDATCLGPDRMGTQEVTVQTIKALAERKDIDALVVYVPHARSAQVDALRTELGDVTFVPVNPVVDRIVRTVDVIYRPYQVATLAEIDFLRFVADRFIVNQLDTIAFGDPAYFRNHDEWVAYRDLTRLTFQLAGGIVFPSEHSRAAARAAGLLEASTPTDVVSCGITRPDPCAEEAAPARGAAIRSGYLLCIGASYLHKNRPFVLEVWAELRQRGWDGQLVLAGPSPPYGNSEPVEAAFLLSHPSLREDLVTLGSITEEEKRWLFRRAGLVMYPSTVEGFGFVPFEAAAYGAPTLATRQGSLDETLPADLPTLATFEVGAAADLAEELLADPDRTCQVVEILNRRATAFSWESVAERLMDVAQEVLRQPVRRAVVIEGEGAEPTGVVSRGRIGTEAAVDALNRAVAAIIRRPALKRTLSPNGSGRQAVARRVIATARRNIH